MCVQPCGHGRGVAEVLSSGSLDIFDLPVLCGLEALALLLAFLPRQLCLDDGFDDARHLHPLVSGIDAVTIDRGDGDALAG